MDFSSCRLRTYSDSGPSEPLETRVRVSTRAGVSRTRGRDSAALRGAEGLCAPVHRVVGVRPGVSGHCSVTGSRGGVSR